VFNFYVSLMVCGVLLLHLALNLGLFSGMTRYIMNRG